MRQELYERIRFRGKPVAHPSSVVTFDNKRFTILTDCLIRLEWSPDGEFESITRHRQELHSLLHSAVEDYV
jgi:hypothetical protein